MPGPYSYLTGVGNTYYNGSFGAYPIGPTPNPKLTSAIDDLLTPGLVPDIARQSAELSAGRGIAGSPAADSTAVRMSEQNWLQRLGLANTLMSGQTARDLPYQITPWQQAWLNYQNTLRGLNQGGMRFGGGGSGGGGGGYSGTMGTPMSPWSNTYPIIEAVRGTRPDSSGSGGGIVDGGYQGSFDLDSVLEELGLGVGFNGEDEGGVQYPDFPEWDF